MSVITGSPGLKHVPGQGMSAIDRTAKRSSDSFSSGTISGATSRRGACRIHFAITRVGREISSSRASAAACGSPHRRADARQAAIGPTASS